MNTEPKFTCPRTYSEFTDQFPTHIDRWLNRNVTTRNQEDREDLKQELHLAVHLAIPRSRATSKPSLLAFVNRTLRNCLIDRTRHNQRDALNQTEVCRIGDGELNDDQIHLQSETLREASCLISERTFAGSYLSEFRSYVSRHDWKLGVVFDAIVACDTMKAAQKRLGISRWQLDRCRQMRAKLWVSFNQRPMRIEATAELVFA